jgi:hypothetical protein
VVSVLATGPKVRGFDPRWPDGSGGHIRIDRTAARPVGQSPTATNAHDTVTSERGGKRRPEPI